MAKRTINSPGVEIGEVDLSLRLPTPAGTTVYVTGYTDQGPSDEVLSVTSLSEFEQIYGIPKTPAERYFYHTVKATLNSSANLLVNRLPYGSGTGQGFGSSISLLAYPVRSATTTANINVLSSFNVSLNFGNVVRAAALSGAAFNILLSNSRSVTVNFAVDGSAPVRGVDARNLDGSATTFTVPVDTTTVTTTTLIKDLIVSTINLSAGSQITAGSAGTKSLNLALSGWVQTTFTGSVSSSIVEGLEDQNDIFTLTQTSLLSGAPSSALSTNLEFTEGSYLLGEPTQYNITSDEYSAIVNGTMFDWSKTAVDKFTTLGSLSGAGVIVINKGQTIIDGKYQGYYVGLADNTNINPATNYDAITTTYTVTQSAKSTGLKSYISVPTTRFDFSLTATPAFGNNPATGSISQIMEEKITSFDTSTTEFDDTLNVGIFKLRQSVFASDATTLSYVLEEGYNGSIGYHRQINGTNGGSPVNFFLENVENNSRNVDIIVNPFLSDYFTGINLDSAGKPLKKVRIVSQQLIDTLSDNVLSAAAQRVAGVTLSQVNEAVTAIGRADALYPLGAYGEVKINDKAIGDIPTKLKRALDGIKNDEVYNIDILAEAGLGTIWTTLCSTGLTYFDDTKTSEAIEALRVSTDLVNTSARDYYNTIFSQFNVFCGPIKDGGRGDVLFVADPIRQILISGKDTKVINTPGKNFSQHIYWALRHQFENANTSYATTYANYFKVYDNFSGLYIYVPPSGFIAAKMASADADVGPWIAPAGFNRGIINDALDIAFAPNQRQRDELYKVNLNPVTRFPDQGIVIYGQKTLLKKPSAFDRINVRRSFLYLEKATKSVMKFFLFENNTLFTRTRVVNTLKPFFEKVKQSDGLYDYLIVCDNRNNTTEVIDNNELVVDIYLKPVKSAEFILVNFYATRSDTNFQELAGG